MSIRRLVADDCMFKRFRPVELIKNEIRASTDILKIDNPAILAYQTSLYDETCQTSLSKASRLIEMPKLAAVNQGSKEIVDIFTSKHPPIMEATRGNYSHTNGQQSFLSGGMSFVAMSNCPICCTSARLHQRWLETNMGAVTLVSQESGHRSVSHLRSHRGRLVDLLHASCTQHVDAMRSDTWSENSVESADRYDCCASYHRRRRCSSQDVPVGSESWRA